VRKFQKKKQKKKMEIVLFERSSFRIRTAARMVVRSPNAVHSVLYRVVVFVNASRRRFLLQVEFRARILRVVYVGAIAVLFRFVVMMLNLSETTTQVETKSGRARGQVFGGMTLRLGVVRVSRYSRSADPIIPGTRTSRGIGASLVKGHEERRRQSFTGTYVEWVKRRDPMWGMTAFGQVLYTDGMMYVVGAGMVLLVAMLGSIVLTLKVRTFARAKRQQVDQQRSRDADQAVRRVKNR
jgi:NADH-quinone oxidoreductase subunit J